MARDFVDKMIVEGCSLHEALQCIHIGLLCVQDSPNDRSLMSLVVSMLNNEAMPRPMPRQPLFFAQRLLGTPVNYHAGEPWKTHSKTLDGNTRCFLVLSNWQRFLVLMHRIKSDYMHKWEVISPKRAAHSALQFVPSHDPLLPRAAPRCWLNIATKKN
jgi:hypothetical protein